MQYHALIVLPNTVYCNSSEMYKINLNKFIGIIYAIQYVNPFALLDNFEYSLFHELTLSHIHLTSRHLPYYSTLYLTTYITFHLSNTTPRRAIRLTLHHLLPQIIIFPQLTTRLTFARFLPTDKLNHSVMPGVVTGLFVEAHPVPMFFADSRRALALHGAQG